MLRRWWINFQGWRSWRHYKRKVRRDKWPAPYKSMGWEFDKWEVK